MVRIIEEKNLEINLDELKSILPHAAFVRMRKQLLRKRGFVNLSEFARNDGKTKQAWSKHIRGQIHIVDAPKLTVLRVGGLLFIRKNTVEI